MDIDLILKFIFLAIIVILGIKALKFVTGLTLKILLILFVVLVLYKMFI